MGRITCGAYKVPLFERSALESVPLFVRNALESVFFTALFLNFFKLLYFRVPFGVLRDFPGALRHPQKRRWRGALVCFAKLVSWMDLAGPKMNDAHSLKWPRSGFGPVDF